MPRILHVITGLNVGGAETMLYKLLSAGSTTYAHSVVSLAPPGPMGDRIAGLGVPVHSLHLRPAAPNPVRVWAVRSLARRLAPDLIVGWMYHGNLMASLAGWGLGNTRVLWSIRSSIYDFAYMSWRTAAVVKLGARLSAHPAGIIYVSRVSRGQHEERGYHSAKAVVIPNGIDCKEFVPNERERAKVRAELGLAEDSIVVGLVARRHPVKNQPGFLQTAALVARECPAARFLLVGPGVAEDSGLQALIQKLGLQQRVRLIGNRDDMPRITSALDIACSASLSEAFPNTIGEAMACGVPCAVTNVGDSAFLVGETGVSVPPGNPQDLARAVQQLIAAGPAGRRQLGARARRRIEENSSLPAIAAQYEKFYSKHLACAQSEPSAPEINDLDPAVRA